MHILMVQSVSFIIIETSYVIPEIAHLPVVHHNDYYDGNRLEAAHTHPTLPISTPPAQLIIASIHPGLTY